ncbi:MAG: hypothetical protein JW844_07820 [Candidatus Omnitrophica bacterium]|nr:hypothetical protein [Candidatus Omnitrophota bacterium]
MKYLVLLLSVFLVATSCTLSYAQEAKEGEDVIVEGTVEAIAEDGSYIVVNKTKIMTTPEIVDEAFFELGDTVIITAEKTEAGLNLLDYEYVFADEAEDEADMYSSEEPPFEPVPSEE